MKKLLRQFVMFLLVLSIGSITSTAFAQQATSFEVTAIEGEPRVREGGWTTTSTVPLNVGDFVSTNDRIELDAGETVTIYCGSPEKPTHTMYGRGIRQPSCPVTAAPSKPPVVVTSTGTLTTGPNQIPAEDLAFLVSASNGKIRDLMPTIQWEGPLQAPNYNVVITNEAMLPFDILQTSLTEFSFTEALDPGIYNVTIQPLDETGNEINLPQYVETVTFEIVDQVTEENIADDLAMIEDTLGEGNSITAYTQAVYFAGHGYLEEGIELLMGLTEPSGDEADQLSGSAQVYLVLGELYQRDGQFVEAANTYANGLEIAMQGNNPEKIAQLQIGLARVSSEPERVAELYAEAIAFYEMVGDDGLLELLQEELDAIN